MFVQNLKHFGFLSQVHGNCLFFSIVPEQVSHCQQEKYTGLVFYPIYTHSLRLVLDLVVYTYCYILSMQCNTLIRKHGKKKVFLLPSSLTGGLRVSFMCWIHPYRPPGSINCLLQWSSVPQCGTSLHLVDSSLLSETMALILLSFYLCVTHIQHAVVLFLSLLLKLSFFFIFSWHKVK